MFAIPLAGMNDDRNPLLDTTAMLRAVSFYATAITIVHSILYVYFWIQNFKTYLLLHIVQIFRISFNTLSTIVRHYFVILTEF